MSEPNQNQEAQTNQDQQATNTDTGAEQQPEQATTKQPDVSSIVTKESRKAVEKLLKDAGITPDDNQEMQLKEYKKWLDSQKTELQMATETVGTLQKERDSAIAERQAMEKTLSVLKKGVTGDKAEKYVKLAEAYMSDNVDFDAAVDLALKDFPVTAAVPAGGGANPSAEQKQKDEWNPKGVEIAAGRTLNPLFKRF